ncbi:MAG: hypothetical protein ACI93E_000946 [Flavobacteriales bacterium]
MGHYSSHDFHSWDEAVPFVVKVPRAQYEVKC